MTTFTGVDCPIVDQDLTDWDFVQDPYPRMEEWRSLGPVVYNSRHDDYMVMSHRNNAKVLSDIGQFNSQAHREMFIRAFGGVTMEALDSPRHHEMRGVWADFFRRDSLESQRQMVSEIVTARMDEFVERIRWRRAGHLGLSTWGCSRRRSGACPGSRRWPRTPCGSARSVRPTGHC